jgi:aspartate carbamoyltransferase catalytic subunit
MITAPNKYLGISADKLPYIATELEQKNATLTAENVLLQKELEAEHALAEALGHELEQAKGENAKLRELCKNLYDFAWFEAPTSTELNFEENMEELGIEVRK